ERTIRMYLLGKDLPLKLVCQKHESRCGFPTGEPNGDVRKNCEIKN
uniref:Uncharacterized protein n=1 Tax=Parascaris univalens TaxID=6257 RepID=A0A915AG58_PARUN